MLVDIISPFLSFQIKVSQIPLQRHNFHSLCLLVGICTLPCLTVESASIRVSLPLDLHNLLLAFQSYPPWAILSCIQSVVIPVPSLHTFSQKIKDIRFVCF